MHLHSTVAILSCAGLVAGPLASAGDAAEPAGIATAKATLALPCIESKTCSVTRTWDLPKCAGMKIEETQASRIPDSPGNDDDCQRRSFWLSRATSTSPVLLAEDCVDQTGADSLGTAKVEVEKCDLRFRYLQYLYDDNCMIRDVGIHLNSLALFGETESVGVMRKGECRSTKRRAIHLPPGKGVVGAPLVALDGPTAQEVRERERILKQGSTRAKPDDRVHP
jgi:hypothetical protein